MVKDVKLSKPRENTSTMMILHSLTEKDSALLVSRPPNSNTSNINSINSSSKCS